MKKIILLIIGCAFITGCQMDYRLDFKNDTITEIITSTFDEDIYEAASKLDGDSFYIEKELAEEEIPSLIDHKDYYQKNIDIQNGISTVTLKYNYNYENFENTYMANYCFENKIFMNEEDYYYLSLSGEFLCSDNKNVEIKISSDKAVLSENADEYKDGYYIWYLKTSEDEHNITFQISKDILTDEVIVTNKINVFPIIGAVILVIAIAIFLVLKKKINKDA